jgi:hypothetical protein
VFPAEDRGTGELDLKRDRDGSAEKKRGNVFPDRRQPSPLLTIYSGSGAQQWRHELVSMAASVCSERGSGGEANERQGRAPEGGAGLYLARVVAVQGAPRRSRLGARGGISGAAL